MSNLYIEINVDVNSSVAEIIPAIAKTFRLYIMYKIHVMLFEILIFFKLEFASVIVYIVLPIHGNKLIGPL